MHSFNLWTVQGIVEDFKLRPDEYKEKSDGSASIISSYTAG